MAACSTKFTSRRNNPTSVGGRLKATLPGFRLTFWIACVWLGLIVALPLLGLFGRAATLGAPQAWALFASPRTLAAFRVSFGCAAIAAVVNAPLGVLLAWVLTRYEFTGRRLMDALIDLPFALPTAVAGIALTTLYADTGWLGRPLSLLGISVAFTPAGITVAMAFIGLPFVVRSVQPVLVAADRSAEEVALTLGAGPFAIFRRVVLPPLVPAILSGVALALARGVGEYGSVIFIAGNRPGVSEILPLLIVTKLEQYDYPGAAALGAAMLVVSFILLVAIRAGGARARPV